jgi:large subunit ribosomal protein L1
MWKEWFKMAKFGKRYKAVAEKIQIGKTYAIDEGIALIKSCATAKFKESIDVSVNLGVDPRKSDQAVRGSTVLPNGTGKTVRVAVFAQGEKAEEAKAAGADVVGMADLAATMKGGDLNFGVVIAAPDAMGVVGQLGQLLGPRGLMPNPKVGTVAADVATAVKNAKSGQVRFRADKGGIVHCTIGKAEFEVNALRENLKALLLDLEKAKPSTAKGIYLRKICLSTTMGPSIQVDHSFVRAGE